MRVEHSTHFGDVVVLTVELLVPLVHAELPLAGADGRGAGAVVGQGRGHGQGLHSGLPPQRRFTCGTSTSENEHGGARRVNNQHDAAAFLQRNFPTDVRSSQAHSTRL